MDVSVLSKYGQRSLRSAARASVLGNGLLERTRSTSLALLGLTAAIGLAMVALALNQGWPLIEGAPIPGLGGGHEAVGAASVAAPATGRDVHSGLTSGAARRAGSAVSTTGPRRTGHSARLGGSHAPRATGGLVVSQPTSTSPAASPGGEATPGPPPAQPTATSAPAPAPESAPAVNPPASSPEPSAQGTPESPAPAQNPPVADNGEGHGHGRHLGRGGGHGHGHRGGEDDSNAPESGEAPESAPVPSETPPPEASAPEETNGGQSHAPSWGHDGGRGNGHGHW